MVVDPAWYDPVGFMDRRELLKAIGLLLGGSVSTPVASTVLEIRPFEPAGSAFVPRTLSQTQNHLVTAVAEAILPATDTPGAAAAGVNEFIDLMLTEWLDAEEVRQFLAGLDELASLSRSETGRSFVDLRDDEQLRLLEPLDLEVFAQPENLFRFFRMMKQMTLAGYYTSEIGMTQELRLPEIRGSYAGCVPYSEIGRSWA